MASIPACHAGDRGSIPRRGTNFCYQLFGHISFYTIILWWSGVDIGVQREGYLLLPRYCSQLMQLMTTNASRYGNWPAHSSHYFLPIPIPIPMIPSTTLVALGCLSQWLILSSHLFIFALCTVHSHVDTILFTTHRVIYIYIYISINLHHPFVWQCYTWSFRMPWFTTQHGRLERQSFLSLAQLGQDEVSVVEPPTHSCALTI